MIILITGTINGSIVIIRLPGLHVVAVIQIHVAIAIEDIGVFIKNRHAVLLQKNTNKKCEEHLTFIYIKIMLIICVVFKIVIN